tara:strand:+ start:1732 stop:2424 length:693 start_codon:yes stop_codon:yes gene_type:complete
MNTYLNRFEKKFFINAEQEKKLKENLKNIFFLDKLSRNNRGYYCLSVYFDNLNMDSMNAKIEGFSKRTKIRARSYLKDLDEKPKTWNFEIKNKENSIVSKKKFSIDHDKLMKMFLSKNYNQLLNKNFETIDAIYQPTYIICYFREAYNSDIFSHCRITIDKEIICNKFSINFMKEIKQNRNFVIDLRKKLMELKYSRFLPASLSNLFQSLSLTQITFSKYVDGILNQKNL